MATHNMRPIWLIVFVSILTGCSEAEEWLVLNNSGIVLNAGKVEVLENTTLAEINEFNEVCLNLNKEYEWNMKKWAIQKGNELIYPMATLVTTEGILVNFERLSFLKLSASNFSSNYVCLYGPSSNTRNKYKSLKLSSNVKLPIEEVVWRSYQK